MSAFTECLRSPERVLMAITQDGLARSHVEQVRLLLAAGVTWIQLRCKTGTAHEREEWAEGAVALCREQGAWCVINDHVALAAKVGATGAHVGRLDGDWREARAVLGPQALLGGTVNDDGDARRAVDCGVLDYVGLGPWRFTATKKNLSPVLGPSGVHALVPRLAPLPVWVIGGVQPADLPTIRDVGAAGVAVSGGLVAATDVTAAAANYLKAWA